MLYVNTSATLLLYPLQVTVKMPNENINVETAPGKKSKMSSKTRTNYFIKAFEQSIETVSTQAYKTHLSALI